MRVPLPARVRRAAPELLTAAALLAGSSGGIAPGAGRPTQPPPRGGASPCPPPMVVVAAPFAPPAGPYGPGHRGVDLAAAPAAGVLAAGPGTVAFAGRVAGRGVVSVDHPGGLRTTYQPVGAAVTRGEPVRAGQLLGLLEGTGGHCLPRACLHWGLRRGTTYLDPMSLLGPARVRLLPVWTP